MHRTHWVQEVWQIRGRHFFDRKGNFSRRIAPRMSAQSARDSIMRPPRHQSRESSEARGLLPASASIVESRKPLARLNVPSASSGMTTPASRASCRSLRLLTRSTAPRIHPLETLTTTAQNPACTTSPPTPQPPQPTRTPHHRFTPVLSSSTQPQTR